MSPSPEIDWGRETRISELSGAALPALDELTAQIQELRTLAIPLFHKMTTGRSD